VRRLTGKAPAVLLTVLGAAVVLVSSSRSWVTGRVDDAVLGSTTVAAMGTDVAPGLAALALVGIAGAVAAVAAARWARRIAAGLVAASTLTLLALCARVLLDPAGLLGPLAAKSAGRTGTLPTTGTGVTAWPWLALAGALLALIGSIALLLGQRQWTGLSARYDRDQGGTRVEGGKGARGERVPDAWEQLSAGVDPTESDPDRPERRADADSGPPT
jgi:uncharacterized membrane protein (TIGR02234 family)